MEDGNRDRINGLYWESDRSVADIADEVGVSRRTLYDSIEPRPAGTSCPDCGSDMGFRNRTAADNLEAECSNCGVVVELDEAPMGDDLVEPQVEQERAAARLAPVPRTVPPQSSGPLLGTSLVAGLVAGAAAGYLLRRR